METIVLITAMEEEATMCVEHFGLSQNEEKYGMAIHTGVWNNKEIVLCTCRIGKVAAASAAMYLAEHYTIALCLNVGIAGSCDIVKFPAGSVFIPDSFVQHDVCLPFDGPHLDYIKKPIYYNEPWFCKNKQISVPVG